MEQVKIISSNKVNTLEEKINLFLKEKKDCISVKDIKYICDPKAGELSHHCFAMIRYEEL